MKQKIRLRSIVGIIRKKEGMGEAVITCYHYYLDLYISWNHG